MEKVVFSRMPAGQGVNTAGRNKALRVIQGVFLGKVREAWKGTCCTNEDVAKLISKEVESNFYFSKWGVTSLGLQANCFKKEKRSRNISSTGDPFPSRFG